MNPKPRSKILPRSFYQRATIQVARDLLGTTLSHGPIRGRIVEVEAYLGEDDLAAHSSKGKTPRTEVIFGPPGHAYVYLIYGVYECLNIVAEPAGTPGCVLIRAIEPVDGIEHMRTRRPTARKIQDLANGPGKLTRAIGVDRRLNGADVTKPPLTVSRSDTAEPFEIVITPRIGITQCADWPLRFYIRGNPFVSKAPR